MSPPPPPSDGERAARAAGELVEVVDLDGRVERLVPRATMRAERLRHRCTYLAVVDGGGRLVVHQRAPWKDVWPSRWDLAFGGVADVGEDWLDAARRELREEAGIVAPCDALELVAEGPYDDEAVSVLGRAYLVRTDATVTFDDGEVVADDRIPMADLARWLAEHETCPDSVQFLGAALLARAGTDGSVG